MKYSFDDLCDVIRMIAEGLINLGKDVYNHVVYGDIAPYGASDSSRSDQGDRFDPY